VEGIGERLEFSKAPISLRKGVEGNRVAVESGNSTEKERDDGGRGGVSAFGEIAPSPGERVKDGCRRRRVRVARFKS
jgi:hypothetical protein